MTSKNSFFKLLREHAKQSLWLIALASLVSFFIFPVVTAVMTDSLLNAKTLADQARLSDGLLTVEMCRDIASRELIENFYSLIAPNGPVMFFFLTMGAIVCGLSGFSYLFSRKKTDFYHCLPVKRETLFAVSYIGGILYIAVPYLIGLTASGLLVQIKAISYGFSWGTLFADFFQGMSFFILTYSTVVAAAVLTGNIVVSLLGTFFFFFWGPFMVFVLEEYCRVYFSSFYCMEGWMAKLSYEGLSPLLFHLNSATNELGFRSFIALAVGGIIGAVSLFLYKKRPSEAAGWAMSFRVSQPIIKIAVMVPSALGVSLFFYGMRGRGFWPIFGLVCGLLISGCIVEMIYHFDVKKAFWGWKGTSVGALISLVIFCLFLFDLAGYDTYLPKKERVESVGISSYLLYNHLESDRTELEAVRNSNGTLFVNEEMPEEYEVMQMMRITDPEAIEAVLKMAEEGIRHTDENGEDDRITPVSYSLQEGVAADTETIEIPEEWEQEYTQVVIQYHMKDGTSVTRRYFLDLLDVREMVDQLYNSEDFKKESYPVLNMEGSEIVGANFRVFGRYSHVDIDEEKLPELLAAYQEEFSTLTMDERRTEAPLGYIQFKTQKMQDTIDLLRKEKGDYTRFNDLAYYPVYESFEKTVSLLREAGVEMADSLMSDTVERIVMRDTNSLSESESFTPYSENGISLYRVNDSIWLEITDPEKIKQILDCAGSSEDPLYQEKRDTSLYIEVYGDIDTEGETDTGSAENIITSELSFRKGKIPAFVEEMFKR